MRSGGVMKCCILRPRGVLTMAAAINTLNWILEQTKIILVETHDKKLNLPHPCSLTSAGRAQFNTSAHAARRVVSWANCGRIKRFAGQIMSSKKGSRCEYQNKPTIRSADC